MSSRVSCKNCGQSGEDQRYLAGSNGPECALWVVPIGLFIWGMYASTRRVFPEDGSEYIRPMTPFETELYGILGFIGLAFLVAGILYSIYRQAGAKRGCSYCGSFDVVPYDSPVGQQLRHTAKAAQRRRSEIYPLN
ncbi:MAG TPA: hypothetical protein VN622_00195 [Clostridia bacterium]|nr:hypothetical protein [Clostridia bacterium]